MSLNSSYFHQACSWAEDKFGLIEASRARYQLAFIIAMSAVICLAIVLMMLLPLKSVQTIAVHHYDNGVTTVEAQNNTPAINQVQIESDIVRYVINRESYDVSSYQPQFELINLLSSNDVANQYEAEQSTRNPFAPINQLGTKVTRAVHVYSINFIDEARLNKGERKAKQTHHNLAEVVFSIKDKDKATLKENEQAFTALISWHYLKPSNSIEERWKNFDGFEVTRYSKAQRNL